MDRSLFFLAAAPQNRRRQRAARPRVGVLLTKVGGALAESAGPQRMQDVFVTELVKKATPVAIPVNSADLIGKGFPRSADGDVARLCRQHRVDCLLISELRVGAGASKGLWLVASINDQTPADWYEEKQVSVGGFGGGVDDLSMQRRRGRLVQAVRAAVRQMVAEMTLPVK